MTMKIALTDVLTRALLTGAAIVALLFGFSSRSWCGTTIHVTNPEDTVAATLCSLRDAITAVNAQATVNGCAGAGADMIDFTNDVTGVQLKTGLPAIRRDVTISGTNSAIWLFGIEKYRIMTIQNGANVTLNRLIFWRGHDTGGGGALEIFHGGNVTVNHCDFEFNDGGDGGAISNDSTHLTINESSFAQNKGKNIGAIDTSAAFLTINNSLFVGNDGRGSSAVASSFGTMLIQGSTFVANNNTHPTLGGAVTADHTTVTILNSTITTNQNGAVRTSQGPTFIGNSTIANNTIGGNSPEIETLNDPIRMRNSIVSGPRKRGGPNCKGTITNLGYNISDDGSCRFDESGPPSTGALGQKIGDNVAPRLEELESNGGPTATLALIEGSPAIDAIPQDLCVDQAGSPLLIDQRGAARPAPAPQDPTLCDIGAFEFGGHPPAF
jgi:hypothetical protein